MRKLRIVALLILGFVAGYYIPGCLPHSSARATTAPTPEPQPGQLWRALDGTTRVVRCVTHEDKPWVWWYHEDASGADRHCTIKTWRAWVRSKKAKLQP